MSDHALVRFLDRAGGFDVEALRSVLEESLQRATRAAGKIGATRYRVFADGLTYVVEDNVVVTITPQRVRRGRL